MLKLLRTPPTGAGGPLDSLLAAHDRLHAICEAVVGLSSDPERWVPGETIGAIRSYFASEHRLLVADEEEDLLPLLGRRLGADPDFSKTALHIRMDHSRDRQLIPELLQALARAAARGSTADGLRLLVHGCTFAEVQRRHIAFEHERLIPLARRSLTATDLARMSERMAERRARLVAFRRRKTSPRSPLRVASGAA